MVLVYICILISWYPMPKKGKGKKKGNAMSLADFQQSESATQTSQPQPHPPNAWNIGSAKIKDSVGGHITSQEVESKFIRNYDLSPQTHSKPSNPQTVHSPEDKQVRKSSKKSKAQRVQAREELMIKEEARKCEIRRQVQRSAKEREYLSFILSLVGTIMVNISYLDGTLHSFELNYKDTIYEIKQELGTRTRKNETNNKLYIEGISSELDDKQAIREVVRSVGKKVTEFNLFILDSEQKHEPILCKQLSNMFVPAEDQHLSRIERVVQRYLSLLNQSTSITFKDFEVKQMECINLSLTRREMMFILVYEYPTRPYLKCDPETGAITDFRNGDSIFSIIYEIDTIIKFLKNSFNPFVFMGEDSFEYQRLFDCTIRTPKENEWRLSLTDFKIRFDILHMNPITSDFKGYFDVTYKQCGSSYDLVNITMILKENEKTKEFIIMKHTKNNYSFENDIYPYMDQEITRDGYVRLDTPTILTITYCRRKYDDFVCTIRSSFDEYLNKW